MSATLTIIQSHTSFKLKIRKEWTVGVMFATSLYNNCRFLNTSFQLHSFPSTLAFHYQSHQIKTNVNTNNWLMVSKSKCIISGLQDRLHVKWTILCRDQLFLSAKVCFTNVNVEVLKMILHFPGVILGLNAACFLPHNQKEKSKQEEKRNLVMPHAVREE